MAELKMPYQVGDTIPSHFNAAIVTASYFASLCGCLLTVEILHRRGTGVFTLRSCFETLACAISLGTIGIWCMHWIGNRAITLGDGQSDIQLVYSSGFSTLSVFLPIFGLCAAFAAAEYPIRRPWVRMLTLTGTGIFAGLSVVGMHYIGNLAISNYRLHYKPPFLIGSVVIAIGDCLAVLMLFYFWREKWISNLWKRALCAVFLAGGISAMHFTASTNCHYILKSFNAPSAIHARNVQVIVAGVLCTTAAVLILGVLFFTRHRASAREKSSQKIMLACALFDPEGNILVTTEGVLPAREITENFNFRTFAEEFDRAHPIFHWLFRVTRNWGAICDLITKMKNHLSRTEEEDSPSSSRRSSVIYDSESSNYYSVVFRERFCTAASSLAESMRINLENIGVLYDHIVDTGTLQAGATGSYVNSIDVADQDLVDIEAGLRFNPVGKGQLLFLTRRLKEEEKSGLLNAGFKFASVRQVGRSIADSIQIPRAVLNIHMSALTHYVDGLSDLKKPGTWMGFFTLLPKVDATGFDVAVKRNEQDQLPDVQFLNSEPLQWQAAFLERMDGLTTAECSSFLENRYQVDLGRTRRETTFATSLLHAMDSLHQQLPRTLYQKAKFNGYPVQAYYSEPVRGRLPITTIYAFTVCADLHTSLEAQHNITRIPFTFFRVRHQCYNGSSNHLAFARDIHKEFAPLLARIQSQPDEETKKLSARLSNLTHKPKPAKRRLSWRPTTESSSDSHELGDLSSRPSDKTSSTHGTPARDSFLGGILVNSETVINRSLTELNVADRNNNANMGVRVDVGTSQPLDTFVDQLYRVVRDSIPSRTSVQ